MCWNRYVCTQCDEVRPIDVYLRDCSELYFLIMNPLDNRFCAPVYFLQLLLLSLFFSCEKENEMVSEDPKTNPDVFAVSIRSVLDIANNGGASDVAIHFNTPTTRGSISAYEVAILKSNLASSFTTTMMVALPENRKLLVNSMDQLVVIRLPEDMPDTDGDPVVEGATYHINILSKYTDLGNEGSVMVSSAPFSLMPYVSGVQTISVQFASTDGLDGLAIDSEGNLYVSNYGVFPNGGGTGSEIYKITPEGTKSTFATGLNVPSGIVIDGEDNLFVSNGNSIHKISSSGEITRYASYGGGFADLVIDANENIYSGGYSHSNILKIDPDGKVQIIANDPDLKGTVGLAYHEDTDALYAGNFDTGKIFRISLQTQEVDLMAQTAGVGYLTEMNGALYATIFRGHQIARIDFNGTVTILSGQSIPGQEDGSLEQATFSNPNGIVADAMNTTLYVADWGTPRISKIQL